MSFAVRGVAPHAGGGGSALQTSRKEGAKGTMNIPGAIKPRILAALAGGAVLLALALPGAASAAWLKAESPRFIVYSSGDEAFLRAYTAKLETFEDILRTYHGMPPGEAPRRKFEVYLVNGVGQLRRVKPDAADT